MKKTKRKLTSSEIRQFEMVLRDRQKELEKELGIRIIEGVKASDEIDVAAMSSQMETQVLIINGKAGDLRDIMIARQRIKVGEYGICLDCGKSIPLKRLESVPWASFCCQCKEKADALVPMPARRRRISSSNRKVYGR